MMRDSPVRLAVTPRQHVSEAVAQVVGDSPGLRENEQATGLTSSTKYARLDLLGCVSETVSVRVSDSRESEVGWMW